jgi:hypothetical protein
MFKRIRSEIVAVDKNLDSEVWIGTHQGTLMGALIGTPMGTDGRSQKPAEVLQEP